MIKKSLQVEEDRPKRKHIASFIVLNLIWWVLSFDGTFFINFRGYISRSSTKWSLIFRRICVLACIIIKKNRLWEWICKYVRGLYVSMHCSSFFQSLKNFQHFLHEGNFLYLIRYVMSEITLKWKFIVIENQVKSVLRSVNLVTFKNIIVV